MEQKMKLYLKGDCGHLLAGLRELEETLGFNLDNEGRAGMEVSVKKATEDTVDVVYTNGKAAIVFGSDIQFFRAFGLMIERLREGNGDFSIHETPQFVTNGAMIDVSQGNAVLNMSSAKELIRRMAIMGLNMLMLYCEDSFTVESQPYFGYMRARYTEGDMRELDAYGAMFGIELIPCIQTLAHLPDTLNWRVYRHIKEDGTTLLPGEDETYKFIEELLVAASKPFKTKRIHIGMDEAMNLGRGQYLTKNGYVPTDKIMRDHLERVMEIVRKLGLKPMMWSDMFFRAILPGGEYYDETVVFPEGYAESIPKDVSQVYWDYYSENQDFYDAYIAKHRELGGEPIFAGGAITWFGYSLDWIMTEATTNPALLSCKKNNVKEVFVTVWGDNGTECNVFAALPGLALFAEHGYDANPSPEKISKRFNFYTGGVLEDFASLQYLDDITGVPYEKQRHNTSKFLMWQDILTGLFDKNVEGLPLKSHYEKYRDEYRSAAQRNGRWSPIFDFSAHAADVLSLKGGLGLEITAAYKAGNRTAMKEYAEEILPLLSCKVKELRKAHMQLWFDTYKPLGWDIIDMRYGALLIRIQSAIEEITAWLEGRLDRIEELEEPRLPFDGIDGPIVYTNAYGRIVSASRISPIA